MRTLLLALERCCEAMMVRTDIEERSHAEKENPGAQSMAKEDIRELKAHSKARTPVAKVAKAMKRTEGAVRQKAKTIGIGLGHRRRRLPPNFPAPRNKASACGLGIGIETAGKDSAFLVMCTIRGSCGNARAIGARLPRIISSRRHARQAIVIRLPALIEGWPIPKTLGKASLEKPGVPGVAHLRKRHTENS